MATSPSVIRKRALWVLGGLSLATVLLVARLVYLQVFDSAKLSALAQAQRTRTIDLSAKRGEIVDCNGKELAVSIDAYSIYAIPHEVKDFDAKKTAAALAPVLGMTPDDLESHLAGTSFRWLKRQVDAATHRKVEALKLPGIGSVRETKRLYPNGTLAATLLGFVGVDNQGLAGIELSFDKVLRGPHRKLQVQVDAYGHEILREGTTAPLASFMAEGSQVVLTIDEDLQAIAERELAAEMQSSGAERGTVLIMEPQTGNLVAYAVAPTYDPNHYADYSWSVIKNWPATDVYEPGSTMKIFTIGAALDHGTITEDQQFVCPPYIHVDDRIISDHEAPKTPRILTPFEIMEQSSNVGATKIAFTMPAAEHRAFLEKMGFGHLTGSGILGEARGDVPPLPWAHIRQSTIAFGQGISVTPLQILTGVAAVANGGVRVEPRLIDRVVDAKGHTIQTFPVKVVGRVMKPETCQKVIALLKRVVQGGTGTYAQVPGYVLAGKTGTAQKVRADGLGYSPDVVASFVGLVPADQPRYVMLTLLDAPQKVHWASLTAVPLWGHIAADIFRLRGIRPTAPLPSGSPSPLPTPNLHDDH